MKRIAGIIWFGFVLAALLTVPAVAAPLPTVTFRLGTAVSLSSLSVYVDDSDGTGGVDVPASVPIGVAGGPYTNFAITGLPGASPEA